MLAPFYRFQLVNNTGITIDDEDVTISYRPWKLDSQGGLVYDDEVQITVAADVSNGAIGTTPTQDNTSDLFLGLTGGHLTVATGAGTLGSQPHVILLLQTSPDGTSWPDDGEGTVLAVVPISTAAVAEQRDFEV